VTDPLTVEVIVPVTGSGLVRAAATAVPIAAAVTGVGGVSVVTVAEGKDTGSGLTSVAESTTTCCGAAKVIGSAVTATFVLPTVVLLITATSPDTTEDTEPLSTATLRLPPSRVAGSCEEDTGSGLARAAAMAAAVGAGLATSTFKLPLVDDIGLPLPSSSLTVSM